MEDGKEEKMARRKEGDRPGKVKAAWMAEGQIAAVEKGEKFPLHFGDIEKYEIERKIGRGRYADIYQGLRTMDGKRVAIKILKPIKKEKIFREVEILKSLSGCPHVSHFVDIVRDPINVYNVVSIITEYASQEEVDYRLLFKKLTIQEIQNYMRQLLQALAVAHAKKIIHRDVKPHNILFDRETQVLTLIDWGQAEWADSKAELNTRVGGLHYKAPELLLGFPHYDTGIDIWGAGCVFAALVFREDPFFAGKDLSEQLLRICTLKGSDEVFNYIKRLSLKLPSTIANVLGHHPSRPFSKFITPYNEGLTTESAIDLISRMLIVDHASRISAKEALAHPFFNSAQSMII